MQKWGAIVLMLAMMAPTKANSRVIRDNRLHDLGVTPSLGRGYSIATNTYQSQCMGTVDATNPSYDLEYRFVDIERTWENEYRRSFETKNSFRYLFLKSNVNVFTEVEGESTYTYHYIFADLDVDSYYYGLNEGTSAMSDSARSLLEKGDVIGFFDACGPYYIRSIGRHSNFLALLRYRTISTSRDVNFELKLKAKMRGFFSGGSTDTTVDSEFRTETEEKRLSINIWANGLGKGELADIIPTDIESFKAAVQGAIKTMQDPDAGRVTTMEVAPWVENTEFQNYLELESDEDQLLFQKKKTLEANAELIAELDRIDRAQIDQYYKAQNCRRIMEDEYINVEGDFGGYTPENTFFRDLTAPGVQSREITLDAFDQVLSSSRVDAFLEANYQFNYGNSEPVPNPESGAIFCMNEIFRQGIDEVHFRNIPACIQARTTSVPVSPLLDRYCLPELSRIVEEEEE